MNYTTHSIITALILCVICLYHTSLLAKIKNRFFRYTTILISCGFLVVVLLVILKENFYSNKSAKQADAFLPSQNSELLLAIGKRYWNGSYIAENPHRAKKFFEAAANQGNHKALSWLAKLYLFGATGEKNFTKAKAYFQQALERGDISGLGGLGIMYLHGLGLKQDIAKAMALLEEAAQLKDDSSAFELGNIFKTGCFGIEKNYFQARKYYAIAASLGNKDAQQAIEKLGFLGIKIAPMQ